MEKENVFFGVDDYMAMYSPYIKRAEARELAQCYVVGLMKNQINAALTEAEIQRNKGISKVRYKIDQYSGITYKYHGAGKARFTIMIKGERGSSLWRHGLQH